METREVTWDEIQDAALAVCTERQIDVLRLWVAGMGTQRISLALDISGSTAREHLRRALQKTKLELERRSMISGGMSENADGGLSSRIPVRRSQEVE